MAPIDRQHLSRHVLIALMSAFAVFKKTIAGVLHCHFVRRRTIGADLQWPSMLMRKVPAPFLV